MSSRHSYPSHHDDPHEQRLRMIVSLFVPEGPEREAYLAFARELTRSMHREPLPDFERGTKLIVMRWFKRGLHAHLLWLVGQAVVKRNKAHSQGVPKSDLPRKRPCFPVQSPFGSSGSGAVLQPCGLTLSRFHIL